MYVLLKSKMNTNIKINASNVLLLCRNTTVQNYTTHEYYISLKKGLCKKVHNHFLFRPTSSVQIDLHNSLLSSPFIYLIFFSSAQLVLLYMGSFHLLYVPKKHKQCLSLSLICILCIDPSWREEWKLVLTYSSIWVEVL